jgi:cyclase
VSVKRVAVASTGAANLASVLAGLRRAGADPFVCENADEFVDAPFALLPGVGAFGPAMATLVAKGMDGALRERTKRGSPTLAVCLGLQLFCEGSEEAPRVAGLGLVPGTVRRFDGKLPVPQLGWNRVKAGPSEAGAEDGGLISEGWAYFANSYRLDAIPAGFRVFISNYGGAFVAALEGRAPGTRGLLLCQFHPELSGPWGLELLRRWLAGAPVDRRVGGMEAAEAATKGFVRVIPCMDLRDGRVVKGTNFDDLRDSGDPVSLAAVYETQGADELALLDIVATLRGRSTALDVLERIRKGAGIPIVMGGGLRSEEDAGAFLDAGADRVAINSAAVADPELIARVARRFGRQCVVLAIDAAARPGGGGWTVRVEAGRRDTGMDAVEWARRGASLGAGEILLTSIDRDGTGKGFDIELVEAVASASGIPVIASGGAGAGAAGLKTFGDAALAGARGLLAAGVFHRGELTVGEIKRSLAERGIGARS